MPFETLVVSKSGTELSYIDSGAPSKSPYITIFAVHGLCFNNLVFQKVKSIFLARGVRFVAFNRLNYPGSSLLTSEQLTVMESGSEEEKDAWIESRGHEIATFIDVFSQKHNLPPISNDGKSGGIALWGWSSGVSFSLAAICSVETLPADVRDRLTSRIRALIAHDGSPLIFGLPSPEKNWAPMLDPTIPNELRYKVFGHWVTSYFEHGDLSNHDFDSLSYVLASTIRPPSIFNMSKAEIHDMISDGEEATVDFPFLFNFMPQLKANYRKALFDPATAKLFPRMRISVVTGDLAPSWAIAGMWAAQDDEKEFGNGRVSFKVVHGNHFIQWDDPEEAVDAFLECM